MSNYTFQAAPRPVQFQSKRPKYRDPAELTSNAGVNNLMFDSRVVRGNTYAAQPQNAYTLTQTIQANSVPSSSQRRVRSAQPPAAQQAAADSQHNSISLQTEDYLEELADQVFEQENFAQTDGIYEEFAPIAPLFKPRPAGVEVATEIAPGELFNFELSVEPLLEVLVGKCVDQSYLEVLEEEELRALEAQREKFLQDRASILAENQRLEAAAIRKEEEKHRRMQQERDRVARETAIQLKVAANEAARAFLTGLHGRVINQLESQGHFYDPIKKSIEELFMPELIQSVQSHLSEIQLSQSIGQTLISNAINTIIQEINNKRAADEEKRRLYELELVRLEEENRMKLEKLRLEKEAKIKFDREEEERKRKEEEEEEEEDEDRGDEEEDEEDD